jgi:hypothetical protein
VGGHRDQHPLEPLDQRLDGGHVEDIRAELDAEVQLAARAGLDGQRVVVVVAAAELGDGQLADA